jgi:hypothetical protein
MRQFDLQTLKHQLISKIETEVWRATSLKFTDSQTEELSHQSLHQLNELLKAMKEKYAQRA